MQDNLPPTPMTFIKPTWISKVKLSTGKSQEAMSPTAFEELARGKGGLGEEGVTKRKRPHFHFSVAQRDVSYNLNLQFNLGIF